MRLALISDIHGNLTALRAVLEDLERRGVESMMVLGDLAAGGPSPAQVVETVADLGAPVVIGNADQAMLDVPSWWRDPGAVGAPAWSLPVFEIGVWCEEQLGPDHLSYLSSLPETLDIELGGLSMLAFHGSPRSSTDVITAETSDEDVQDMIGAASQAYLAGGHTHVPLIREIAQQTLINPGSVGAPFERPGFAGEVRVLAHAAYAILQSEANGIEVDFVQVPVHLGALEDEARSSGMPAIEWWLAQRQ